jgi:hypothetical protein
VAYREPDPALQAAAEKQVVAEAELEQDAAAGRQALAHRAPGLDRRLVRRTTEYRLEIGAIIGAMAVGCAAVVALGAPIGNAIGVVSAVIAGAVPLTVRRLREVRDAAWLSRYEFSVVGYETVLATRRVVIAISSILTLDSVDDDDRARVADLVGHLEVEDPTIVVEDTKLVIDALVVPSHRALRRFMRGVLEHVAVHLHAARGVRSVQFVATTAAHDRPSSFYR